MAEYIERGVFIELVKDIPMWGSVAAMLADSIPAADDAPVGRCRYCERSYEDISGRTCSYGPLWPAWTPVTERLPENRGNVLVVAYWHERWGVYMGWCAPERAEWYVHIGIGDRSDVAVTHWMPLPPAPEVR